MSAQSGVFRAWPTTIAVVLTVFVGLNIWVATMAIQSDPGRLELHPYEKGLGYEAVLKARRALIDHGWRAELKIRAGTGPGRKTLEIRIVDSSNAPVGALTGRFEAIRPSNAQADRRGPLVMKEAGVYEAQVDFTEPGLWLIDASFDNNGERIVLPQHQEMVTLE